MVRMVSVAYFAIGAAAAIPGMASAQDAGSWSPNEKILGYLEKSANHTDFVKALKATDLLKPLEGKGPFTVLAPTNNAFAELPENGVATLLKPQNKSALTKILGCHVIAGNFRIEDIHVKSFDSVTKKVIETVGGCKLTVAAGKGEATVTDENGITAGIEMSDVFEANGEIQVIDAVLTPKM